MDLKLQLQLNILDNIFNVKLNMIAEDDSYQVGFKELEKALELVNIVSDDASYSDMSCYSIKEKDVRAFINDSKELWIPAEDSYYNLVISKNKV